MAFVDLECEICGHRYGFEGRVVDAPPCPGCSARPNPKELEADQAEIDRFKGYLRDRKKALEQRKRERSAEGPPPPERPIS